MLYVVFYTLCRWSSGDGHTSCTDDETVMELVFKPKHQWSLCRHVWRVVILLSVFFVCFFFQCRYPEHFCYFQHTENHRQCRYSKRYARSWHVTAHSTDCVIREGCICSQSNLYKVQQWFSMHVHHRYSYSCMWLHAFLQSTENYLSSPSLHRLSCMWH